MASGDGLPAGRPHADSARVPLDRRYPRSLVDYRAPLLADPGEAPDELGRVEDRVTPRRSVERSQPERRVDLGLDPLAVHEFELLAPRGGVVDPGPELLDLVGPVGDVQDAGLLETAIDLVFAGELYEGAEVREALALENRQLVRKVADPVCQAMGQAGRAEAAVATACAVPNGIGLEDNDPQGWICVRQGDRRP